MHTRPLLAFALSLPLVAGLSACGQDPAPLTGTWSNTACYGTADMPEDIEECSTTLTFGEDLTVELHADWLSLPATAAYPGCTTTKSVVGQTWSTASGGASEILTVSGDGEATIKRTGCVNASDNLTATSTTGISIPDGDIDYEISGANLTVLTTSLRGTYSN